MQNEQILAKGKEVQIRLFPRGWMVDSVQCFKDMSSESHALLYVS